MSIAIENITSTTPRELYASPENRSLVARAVEASYLGVLPDDLARMSRRQTRMALAGTQDASHIYYTEGENGAVEALLAITIDTRTSNPALFARLEERARSVDPEIRQQVLNIVGQLQATVYTHEMFRQADRQGQKDIPKLRARALQEANIDTQEAVAYLGEFQGLHSMGVQINMPSSHSVLAGEFVPSRHTQVEPSDEQKRILAEVTYLCNQVYFETHYPNSVMYRDGTVESSVFVQTAPEPHEQMAPAERRIAQKVLDRQQILNVRRFGFGRKRVASAVGATFVNLA